ncbi:MAG: hypothetical protein ACRCW2_06305 [Cellulosilyticaceae bacterium]
MLKYKFKKVIILSIVLCAVLSSKQIFAQSIVSLDAETKKTIDSISNIRKQINLITKNAYINQGDEVLTANYKSQIAVYKGQLEEIQSKFKQLPEFNNTSAPQYDTLRSLFTIASYLSFIANKAEQFLTITDREVQYNLLNAIFRANALVEQIGAYTFQ